MVSLPHAAPWSPSGSPSLCLTPCCASLVSPCLPAPCPRTGADCMSWACRTTRKRRRHWVRTMSLHACSMLLLLQHSQLAQNKPERLCDLMPSTRVPQVLPLAVNSSICPLLNFLFLHEHGRTRSGEGWTYFGRQHCAWECRATQVFHLRNLYQKLRIKTA